MRARPLLVFDGDCGFCTTAVGVLEKRLARFPDAQPWQWLDLDALGLSRHDVTHYVWLIAGERRYRCLRPPAVARARSLRGGPFYRLRDPVAVAAPDLGR
ncbi:hypothetical protein ACIQTT_13555 [Microbacterium sp. NPDC090225]|uniref:hypothetical protein n=1 Tax=Microbacterium sp. NPDC090225 TaxID=3364207 RepID=UPI0038172CFF